MIVIRFASAAFIRAARSDVKADESMQCSDWKICILLLTNLHREHGGKNLNCKVTAFTGIVRLATDAKDSSFIAGGTGSNKSLETFAAGFLSAATDLR